MIRILDELYRDIVSMLMSTFDSLNISLIKVPSGTFCHTIKSL